MARFAHCCSNLPFLAVSQNIPGIMIISLLLFQYCPLYFRIINSIYFLLSLPFSSHHHYFIRSYLIDFNRWYYYWKNKIVNYFLKNYLILYYHLILYSYWNYNNLDYSISHYFHLTNWMYLFWIFHYFGQFLYLIIHHGHLKIYNLVLHRKYFTFHLQWVKFNANLNWK